MVCKLVLFNNLHIYLIQECHKTNQYNRQGKTSILPKQFKNNTVVYSFFLKKTHRIMLQISRLNGKKLVLLNYFQYNLYTVIPIYISPKDETQ